MACNQAFALVTLDGVRMYDYTVTLILKLCSTKKSFQLILP